METNSKSCVLFSGGGTSGHVYPAIAIAKSLQKKHPEIDVLFFGTQKGLESEVVPRNGFPFESIEALPFSFRPDPALLRSWRAFKRGEKQCLAAFKKRKVVAVVGTGGYVCAPLMSAAAKQNIPVFLHEQNAYPGRSNRFMARHATTIFLGCEAARPYFSKTKEVLFTGNPVREDFFALAGPEGQRIARQKLGLPLGANIVLLSGGSLGARKINLSVLEYLKNETLPENVQLILATGKRLYQETLQEIKSQGLELPECVRIQPYLDNMEQYMAAADLVVGRAGAGTCAELGVLHKPSVLIPYPYAAGNHQYVNAKVLSDSGSAQLCLDENWNAGKLKFYLQEILLSPPVLAQMQDRASGFAKTDTLEIILSVLERTLP